MAFTYQMPGGEPTVLLGGKEAPQLRVLNCTRSLGGGRLDSCALEVDLTLAGDLLTKTTLLGLLLKQEIEVLLPLPRKTGQGKHKQTQPTVIHWGQVAIVRPQLGDELRLHLVSRLEPWHFGKPLVGRQTYSKAAAGRVFEGTFDRACIFNPVLDGVVIGNKSKRTIGTSAAAAFLDEESGRSELASRWLKEPKKYPERDLWTLPTAVRHVCEACNKDQRFINNPGEPEVQALNASTDLLRDFHLPDGLYLPECLDRLLLPYGYVWWVALERGKRTIRVAKRGAGERVAVYHQPAGEKLDPARTNQERLDVQLDVAGRTFNHLAVFGDYTEVESTFELVRCWAAGSDELSEEDLQIDAAVWRDNPTYADAWRKWALNEAGDCVNLRPEITQPYDLGALFTDEDLLPRRRQFLPCITLNEDGSPYGNKNGYHVEISADAGATWESILVDAAGAVDPNNQVDILDRECGLYFMGEQPPQRLIDAGADARVRITCSVRSDRRLSVVAKRTGAKTPAVGEIRQVLMMEGRWHKRDVHSTSIFRPLIDSKALTADEVDDTPSMTEFAEQMLDAWNLAEIRGSVVVSGINWSYDLGQSIEGVLGRDLFLNLDPSGTKFPLIESLTYDVEGQALTLGLATFHDDVQPPLRERRRGGRRG